MARSRAARGIVLAAVAVISTAAFLAVPALQARSVVDSPPIDLTAAVAARNCTPCHPVIGASRNASVIFNHAAHLTTDCSACHFVNPHENGKTAVPTMASCFTCHGLEHGPTGKIASNVCTDCHPKSFTLRPVTHVKDWKAKPHAVKARQLGVNGCLLCHDSVKDCDTCHAKEVPDLGAMPTIYLRTIPIKAKEPPKLIDPDSPTTIGQCNFCHPDVDGFKQGRIIFAHQDHLKRDYQCTVCHPRFAHQPLGTDKNTMQACYRCHGLQHASSGAVATDKCEACHPKGFKLEPATHTVKFLSGDHKDQAKIGVSYCAMCHKSKSCVKCHNGGTKLADGKTGLKVIPADHRKPQWASEHGGLYLAQKGDCAICHDSPSCQQCHLTTMPHPTDWLEVHAQRGRGLQGADCRVCHKDREACQDCHHASVRSTELIAANCVKCHPEMKTAEPTKIKVAGLAEHAVHFNVATKAQYKKDKPYVCDDCHIGFGSTGVRVDNPLTGPHDMRGCYDCHGALDIRNQRIAPWPGSELCRRCHTDLNL
ncbi:MAG: hypothetical protein D9V44_06160 [Actinobacteria bacterium]|nr:MAG: hypothetical protein D9V44_06160 [Actinomycetota bacterium]